MSKKNNKGRTAMLIGGIVVIVAALVALILYLTGVLGGKKPTPPAPQTADKFETEGDSADGSKPSAPAESVPSAEEILASLPKLSKKKAYVVGEDIQEVELTEFYYTRSGSSFPPYFQRFRFFVENGKHYMYHEKREGEEWPLTEKHITISGTIELTDEQWETFWNFIKGGTVESRSANEDIDDGDGGDGPWMYLYWLRDPNDFQEFEFDDRNKVLGFEEFCFSLTE